MRQLLLQSLFPWRANRLVLPEPRVYPTCSWAAASISARFDSSQDSSAATSAAVASCVVCLTCATNRINASSSSLGSYTSAARRTNSFTVNFDALAFLVKSAFCSGVTSSGGRCCFPAAGVWHFDRNNYNKINMLFMKSISSEGVYPKLCTFHNRQFPINADPPPPTPNRSGYRALARGRRPRGVTPGRLTGFRSSAPSPPLPRPGLTLASTPLEPRISL